MKNISEYGFRSLAISILLTLSAIISAQETTPIPENEGAKKSPVSAILASDLVNQYIWRGQDLGNVSWQPTLGIEWKGLSLSAWGSVGISNWADTKELDLTLSYTYKGFYVGITDYWTDGSNYFLYKNGETNHIWEAGIGYDFGFLSISWYTNFAGADGVNGSGNRAYSSYFELKAPFRLGGLEWEGAVGMVPWKTTTYNTNGFAVTNVSLKATKDFVIKDKFHLPVFAGLTANPDSKKFYLLCGISFYL